MTARSTRASLDAIVRAIAARHVMVAHSSTYVALEIAKKHLRIYQVSTDSSWAKAVSQFINEVSVRFREPIKRTSSKISIHKESTRNCFQSIKYDLFDLTPAYETSTYLLD